MALRTWAVVAAVALVAGGCGLFSGSGSPDEVIVSGIPVAHGMTLGAGTPLGSTFRVPRGTLLVGGVLPADHVGSLAAPGPPDRGWRAWLLLTGSPASVLNAIAA